MDATTRPAWRSNRHVRDLPLSLPNQRLSVRGTVSAVVRTRKRLKALVRDWFRLLTFQSTHEELRALDDWHLRVGLVVTCLVGVGRHWHDPHASELQRAGLGSLIYLAALSLFLWLLYLPLRLDAWSLRRMLTFLSLLAPPAALQAIPLERLPGYSLVLGASLLGVITLWRVALLHRFLVRSAGLRPFSATMALLLPLDVIVLALAKAQVDHAIERWFNDLRSFDYLALLAGFCLPVALLSYVGLVIARRS
jgi:hypothetical protein